jgi:CRP-like cAMP-binding protein
VSRGHEIEPVEISPVQQLRVLRLMFGPGGPSTSALAALGQLTTAVRIPKGAIVEREGTPLRTVYLLLEGELKASREGRLLGVFGARNSVGVLATLARDRLGFTCEALADTTALALRADDFLEVLEDHFELMYSAMRGLAHDGIELRRNLMPHAGFTAPVREGVACPTEPLDLTGRILYLRETFGLRRSYIDELAQLARAAEEQRYRPGERLWSTGERATHAAIVLCGAVQGATPAGARFTFGAGDIVGALDTIAQEPRWFDAVASEQTVALSLDSEALVDVWEDRPGLGLDFLRLMATTLISLRERASDGTAPALRGGAERPLPLEPNESDRP